MADIKLSDRSPEAGPRRGRTMGDLIAGGWSGFKSVGKSVWIWTRTYGFLIIVGLAWMITILTLWRFWGFGATFTGAFLGFLVLPWIILFVKVWYNVLLEVGLDRQTGELNIEGHKVPINLWHEVKLKGFVGTIKARSSGVTWSLVKNFNPKTMEGQGIHPSGYTWMHFLADARLFDDLLNDVDDVVQGYWRGKVQARKKLLKDRLDHGRYMDEELFGIKQDWGKLGDPHKGKESGSMKPEQEVEDSEVDQP